MKRLNNVFLTVQNKTREALKTLATKVAEKKNGGAGTVAALILIVIVVGLLITFKGSIVGWVSTLTKRVTDALGTFNPN